MKKFLNSDSVIITLSVLVVLAGGLSTLRHIAIDKQAEDLKRAMTVERFIYENNCYPTYTVGSKKEVLYECDHGLMLEHEIIERALPVKDPSP